MKRMFVWVGVAVVLVALLVAGCAPEPEPEPEPGEDIVLDFGTFWPAVDFQVSLGFHQWAKVLEARVAAETEHTLKFNFYYSAGPPAALRTGLQNGTYDVITTGPNWHADVFPLWEGPGYPADLCRKNALTMSMAVQALWDSFTPLRDEFAAQEPLAVVMHYWSTGPGYFLMTAGNNVTTLEDFPGKKIRVAYPASVLCIEALGGTGVQIPMSAALEAFQAGTIDGILCPGDTPRGFGLIAYVRSCTYAPFSWQFVFMKLMNKATWDALPANVKTIFNEVNAKYPEYYGKLRTWGEYDGLMFCRSLLGLNINWFEYYLPTANPTEYARWVAATSGLITTWIGGNATRQALWDNFIAKDAYYCTTAPWCNWTHAWPAPPPVPTFP